MLSLVLSAATASSSFCPSAYNLSADVDQDAGQYGVLCANITIATDIVDEPKRLGTLVLTAGQSQVYNGYIGIEIRGSSSQTFPKKQYGFETWTADSEDVDVELAGLPEEEDWILHAPYSDKSLVRNVLAYDLARQMGRYASRCRWAVLTLNGDFQGIYVLMEKLKRDNNRIDVKKNKAGEDDVSGGWVLKVDKATGEEGEWQFETPSGVLVGYEYPKPEDVTEAQKTYITTYFAEFESALVQDPPTYADYIDVDSWVDYFMIIELTKEIDAYRLSAFFHKDRGKKLAAGPVWDQNLGFGNAHNCDGASTSGWAYDNNCDEEFFPIPWWWPKLVADPTFSAAVRARWAELRNSTFSLANINALIDGYVERLGVATIDANFETWDILDEYVWPNPPPYRNQTHAMYIDRLKTWISDRIGWLDANMETVGTEAKSRPLALGSCPDGREPVLQQTPEDQPFYMSVCGNETDYTLFPVANQPQTKEHLCRASTASTPCCGGTYRVLEDGVTRNNPLPIMCIGGVLPANDDLHIDRAENGVSVIMEGCGRGLRHVEFEFERLDNDDDPLSVTKNTLLMSTVDCGHSAGLSAGAVGGIVAGSVLGPFAVATAARALF